MLEEHFLSNKHTGGLQEAAQPPILCLFCAVSRLNPMLKTPDAFDIQAVLFPVEQVA